EKIQRQERFIAQLQADLENEASLATLCGDLARLQQKILAAKAEHLLISDATNLPSAMDELAKQWQAPATINSSEFTLSYPNTSVKEAWIIPSQTNFCSKAFQTVGANHADAPALAVLGGYLRNGFLHTAIREQGGAYGGGASQDSATGAFKFYSYRDPRFKETFDDFDRAIDWFKAEDKGYEQLEQAILGVISGIDKPSSPAGEAKQAYHNERQGRTVQWRNDFRQKILGLTYKDLDNMVERYFTKDNASLGALIQKDNKQQAQDMGMTIREL
ncbi:MAG: insulinase family protein, partial [Bermanella sp.]